MKYYISTFLSLSLFVFAQYAAMVSSAVDHLNTFWVVGVVEQYEGFLEVLEAVLDPFSTNAPLWRKAHLVASNG